MDILTSNELVQLASEAGDCCVSIYIPTHVTGRESQQNSIRLKNMLRQAEERLVGRGMRSTETAALLQPARALLDDELFWLAPSQGLVVFVRDGALFRYRLPLSFEGLLVVSSRFHIKPLLPLLRGDDRCYLLALSQNRPRLFSGNRFQLEPLEVRGLPENLATALNYDKPQEVAQFHSAMTPSQGRPGKQTAVFHGQGGKAEEEKQQIEAYFRRIDQALHRALNGERAPLFLACVESLAPIYRKVNTYGHLDPQIIKGSPDLLGASELHAAAWPLLESHLKRVMAGHLGQFHKLQGSGRTSLDVRAIVTSACQGRVDTLFLADDAHQWGSYDPSTLQAQLHDNRAESDEDLLDLAASATLRSRGSVYAVAREEMPQGAPAAAVYRYAT